MWHEPADRLLRLVAPAPNEWSKPEHSGLFGHGSWFARFQTPTIRAVPEQVDDVWISAPRAAELLGLRLRTVHTLIHAGELEAEVSGGPRRRSIRLSRQDVDDFIERAQIRPGDLRHLHPNWTWARYG